ncbi:dihydrolipoyl dehydrogenase [Castellaniella sp.]|uniref:dihydrolipoyl dehydrogenase n=1 Tax=Castellaniella sp. TaxID=1955812 RepID=UPI00355D3861
MKTDIRTDVLILGAGSAGLYALREVRRAQRDFLLVDPGPLGTTCARVGCMPSKVALHAGALWRSRLALREIGTTGVEALALDRARTWQNLRRLRDQFAGSATDKARSAAGDRLIQARARFLAPDRVEIEGPAGTQHIRANSVVIATGSRPVLPGWLEPVRRHTVTTDEVFELDTLPASVGVLGLGAIGLELGLALSRLGVRVIGADIAPALAGTADPEVAARALELARHEMTLWLETETRLEAMTNGVLMQAHGQSVQVDLLLAALGRRPNVDGLNLVEAGFPTDARGLPVFDPESLQIGDLPVFIAGDANADRPLMHEASDEGAIAGFNASRPARPARFQRKVSLAIAFTDPDLASVGARFDQLDPEAILIGTVTGQSNGRARILSAESSLVRLYAERDSGRLLGASMVASGGEHMAHLLAWAIQRGETAQSLLEMPFYHPVIEEMLQTALQDIVRQMPQAQAWPWGLQAIDPAGAAS